MSTSKIKLRVLVSDDSPTIQKAVRLTLPVEEFEVIAVSDGKSAIDVIQKQSVDLVLVDVNMPEMTGYEVCHAIKVELGRAHLPVILMCGTFDKFDQDRFIWSKATHRIWKPFESSSFLEVIRQHTRTSRQCIERERTWQPPVQSEIKTAGGDAEALTPQRNTETDTVNARGAAPCQARLQPHTVGSTSGEPHVSAPSLKIETINMGVHVEQAVLKWLETEAGRQFIKNLVQKELARALGDIEQSLLDQMRKENWEEDVVNPVRVFQPR